MSQYLVTTFDVPLWPFDAMKLAVPAKILAGGTGLILPFIGGHFGGPVGHGVAKLVAGLLGQSLDQLDDLSLAISSNGRARLRYRVREDADAEGSDDEVAGEDDADCEHDGAEKWMNYCPDCGDKMVWEAGKNPECEECGAPSHAAFNCCWSCGTQFEDEDGEEEANEPRSKCSGYKLEFDCDNEDCGGKVANLMAYCPWCGDEQAWGFDDEEECDSCDSSVDPDWTWCAFCGEDLS